ncbi:MULTISPECIES: hypothetical protein [Burkholderia cepacia complex]|uniref:hypothetical protein n=1 Tax=Burkholderia cepacia complex TaxID=87882 RepID=UPI0012BA565E|nr:MULTISPECIES: hypothetical protein [Burkholderia cepacia complex]
MTERAMGTTRASRLVGISRSPFRYESRRRVNDEALTGRRMAIPAQKRRDGYRQIHVLLQRDGGVASRKRIWRLHSKGARACASGDARVLRLSSARRCHCQWARFSVGRRIF